jgi:hypothetical protein
VDRDLFERRFLEASAHARDFARRFIEEPLPDPMRFHVHLNSSYDGHAGPRFKLFPQDSTDKVAFRTKHLSAAAVVETLWRDGLVPQWVDLSVVGETGDATLLDVCACGRFTAEEKALYYTQTPFAPFSPKGPFLPVGWAEGQRFSIYSQSSCWSREDLSRVMRHASKLWSLELQGPDFRDDLLRESLESPTLEVLDLRRVRLLGSALRCVSRLPRLRTLRLRLRGKVDSFSFGDMPRAERLEHVSLEGVPPVLRGLGHLVSAAPRLKALWLSGKLDTDADVPLSAPLLEELHLSFPHVPAWAKAGPALLTLAIQAPESSNREVGGLLADAPHDLQNLHLRGTQVTDAIFEALSRFPKLRYLDVVGTSVTPEGLHAFVSERPSLRFHPRPAS